MDIYEGDIVKHFVESEHLDQFDWITVLGQVKIIDGCWCVYNERYPLFGFKNEVIGSIHSNPELIK